MPQPVGLKYYRLRRKAANLAFDRQKPITLSFVHDWVWQGDTWTREFSVDGKTVYVFTISFEPNSDTIHSILILPRE